MDGAGGAHISDEKSLAGLARAALTDKLRQQSGGNFRARRANFRLGENKAEGRQKAGVGQRLNHKDRSYRGEIWRALFGVGTRLREHMSGLDRLCNAV